LKEQISSKIIRGILFISFLLTVLFTLLSGVGTYCAAFDTEKYPSMSALLPYQFLYQILMVSSLLIGLWGIWEIIVTLRRKTDYQNRAIIILVAGLVAAATQMIASEILRGNSVPVNFRVYVTLFTLLLFLFARYTPFGQLIGLSQVDKNESAGATALGVALIANGTFALTTYLWVGNSHFAMNGYNWVNDLKGYLNVFGGLMIVLGMGFLVAAVKLKLRKSRLSLPKLPATE
jgi:hypothetical protein